MSIDNNTKNSYTGDEELDLIFSGIRERRAKERAIAAEEAARQKEFRKHAIELKKQNLEKNIIFTTTETIDKLYPDLPMVNPRKSIGRPITPCINAQKVSEEFFNTLGYLTEEIEYGFNKFKQEIAPDIFHILAITAIVGCGMPTLLFELPISFFIKFGIAPALVAELIDKIVDPEARKACLEKFRDFLNLKLDDEKSSGRRR